MEFKGLEDALSLGSTAAIIMCEFLYPFRIGHGIPTLSVL